MDWSKGFPPAAREDARILILGSLPGAQSIAARQYYAHRRNAFWPIMRELLGIQGTYEDRLEQLLAKRIALWDVLSASIRQGSSDAKIDLDSARVNDFGEFLRAHTGIESICFNGKKAEQLFTRFVPGVSVRSDIRRTGLPSTSPAYAAMPFSGKLERWRRAIVGASEL